MLFHKNILVTGGAGFIGSNFVAMAVERGHNVIVLDALTYSGNTENLAGVNPNKCKLIVGNIKNQKLVLSLLNKYSIEAILHFAAESHVDNSINKPADFIETNIVGTYCLLEATRQYLSTRKDDIKNNFRFLHVSTDEVFGALGKTGKFSEESPMRPNSPYSASKAASDHLVHAWFETYGLPTITTNCSNNYGANQYPEKLIPLTIKNALSGKKLPIYGDGSNIRDWIHVMDHARGIFLALNKGRVGQTYCFGGNAEVTNLVLVNKICNILDEIKPLAGETKYSSQIEFVTDRLGHDFRYAIDDTKATKELGFTRGYNLDDGLLETVKWYLTSTLDKKYSFL
ncbi:MAG: dTDP-glucose 4,6-dehydratase [Pseudomonadota bacterium]